MACQVVPDVPAFAVDDGFTYSVPDGMPVEVGSVVRIRMSGRRHRGFVTAVFPEPEGRKLLPVDAVSGSAPVFGEPLLAACRWVAMHYVAPLSTILARTVPPNVPKKPPVLTPSAPGREQAHAIEVRASATPHLEAVLEELGRLGQCPILVPTMVEADRIADAVARELGFKVVVASSSMTNRAIAQAWSKNAFDPETVLVGTRETALWRSAPNRGRIVVEDGRRVMKSPATPTLHARELLAAVTRESGSNLTIISPVPTLESVAIATNVTYPAGRLWAPIEVVDRSGEPPGSSLLTHSVRHAMGLAASAGRSVFVLVANRGYAPAYRCKNCGQLRRCSVCQTTLTPNPTCRRCGADITPCPECGRVAMVPLGAGIGRMVEDIRRFVDASLVGTVDDADPLVVVGSERDLVGYGEADLGVVVDIDGMLGAPHYRASEDTLRLVARLGQKVAGRGERRVIVQTSNPSHPVIHALSSGHPQRFLADELAVRTHAGFPPVGSLIAIEVDKGVDAGPQLEQAIVAPAELRGPAPMRDRNRWLIQGLDLTATRTALRQAVGKLRADGARVRVDVDPIDL